MKENFNLSDLSVRCSGQTGARMKKYMVAKYIRLSMEDLDLCNSEEKAESVSISNQRNFIDTFIEQGEEFQGAEIKEFVDDGYSGTNFDRPAIKELLRSCRQGEIDCIIVKDLSRFGRNYLEVGDYLEQIFPFWVFVLSASMMGLTVKIFSDRRVEWMSLLRILSMRCIAEICLKR